MPTLKFRNEKRKYPNIMTVSMPPNIIETIDRLALHKSFNLSRSEMVRQMIVYALPYFLNLDTIIHKLATSDFINNFEFKYPQPNITPLTVEEKKSLIPYYEEPSFNGIPISELKLRRLE